MMRRSDDSGMRCPCTAEDALLPVLNKRAHLLLDSYNKLRGVVATPLNVSAVVEGQPDPGECLGWAKCRCWCVVAAAGSLRVGMLAVGLLLEHASCWAHL